MATTLSNSQVVVMVAHTNSYVAVVGISHFKNPPDYSFKMKAYTIISFNYIIILNVNCKSMQ